VTPAARPVRRYPLVAFFVLAYALTWWVYPLLSISPLIGLLGLFGPALAAILVTAATDGRAGVRALLRRAVHWRVPLPWWLLALGLPALLSLVAAVLYVVVRPGSALPLGRLTALDLVLVVLVVGEELGWRGYALPSLLERFSPLVASLILGLLWGLWHVPTFFIPGTPQHGQPVVAFLLLTVAYSILLTFLWRPTAGSVLVATLAHGMINVSQGFFLAGVDPSVRYWLLVISYGAAAVVLALLLQARTPRPVKVPAM
jgi:membrane protease YdiL (CAAX protease family)